MLTFKPRGRTVLAVTHVWFSIFVIVEYLQSEDTLILFYNMKLVRNVKCEHFLFAEIVLQHVYANVVFYCCYGLCDE